VIVVRIVRLFGHFLWLRFAHNGLVGGSSPPGPTKIRPIGGFIIYVGVSKETVAREKAVLASLSLAR
jgi:hypothetical protein